MSVYLLPVIGFFIGLIIISLGGGGGGFYVGILTAIFNISPEIAASTSLATVIPTTIVGAIGHAKQGNVNFRLGFIMSASAIVGAIMGSALSEYVPKGLYNKITGVLLLVLGFQMLTEYIKHKKQQNLSNKGIKYTFPVLVKASFYGILGGFMSGLVGISGTTPIVAGLMILNCSTLQMIGTSVFILVWISIAGFLMHLSLGSVDWSLVGLLVLGTTSGAIFAPFILSKISKKTLEKFLTPLIILMVVVMGSIVILK